MIEPSMSSVKPYIVRAFYQWIVDNHLTPYVVVDATHSGVHVPQVHIQDGQIVLNLSPMAVREFQLDDQSLSFDAKFNGILEHLVVPVPAIRAIYAQENGRGTVFEEDEGHTPPPPDGGTDKGSGTKQHPHLTVVK